MTSPGDAEQLVKFLATARAMRDSQKAVQDGIAAGKLRGGKRHRRYQLAEAVRAAQANEAAFDQLLAETVARHAAEAQQEFHGECQCPICEAVRSP